MNILDYFIVVHIYLSVSKNFASLQINMGYTRLTLITTVNSPKAVKMNNTNLNKR